MPFPHTKVQNHVNKNKFHWYIHYFRKQGQLSGQIYWVVVCPVDESKKHALTSVWSGSDLYDIGQCATSLSIDTTTTAVRRADTTICNVKKNMIKRLLSISYCMLTSTTTIAVCGADTTIWRTKENMIKRLSSLSYCTLTSVRLVLCFSGKKYK